MAIKTIAQLKSDVNTNITQNVGTRGITAPILGGEMIDTIDSLSAVDESLEERKANIDGSYDTMTVGLAKNLEGDIYVEGKTYFKPTATVVDDEGAFTSEEVGSGPATIETISGNTVIWNQQWKNTRESGASFGGITMIWVDSYSFYYTGTANTSNDITHTIGTTKGHKYYISVPNANDGLQLNDQRYNDNTRIMEAPGTVLHFGVNFVLGKTYSNSVIFKPIVFDLTLMFGYGNEPSTIEQFKDWLSKNVGLAPYYAYNAGTLINSKPTGIASIGYNLMDLDGTTGTARVPGKYDDGLYGSYYGIRGTYSSVSFVPAATGISESVTPDSDGKFEITSPGEVIVSGAGSSTTVFMWYDGSYTEDSVEYEYTPTTGLDVTKIYGKANGSNTYTQVFPDGIKSINGIRDILDLKNGEATVKIGIFPNLGTLNWSPYSNNRFYSNGLDALVVSASTIFCTKYPSGSGAFDGCIYVGSGAGKTEIRDTTIEQSTAGAKAIKASLANVKGYYVCLNPITYTDLIVSNDGGQTGTPVQVFNYTVDNWGLEELLPQNDYATLNGIVTTAPILNVRYSIDAVEAINTLNDEVADLYESKTNTEGYYPELSVGLADNLKGNDAVTEEFFVRTSGGEAEVANGTASLDGVKGNSVKWNQLIDYNLTNSVTKNNITCTNNSNGSFTISTTNEGASANTYLASFNVRQGVSGIIGHKYYLRLNSNGVLGTSTFRIVDSYSYPAWCDYSNAGGIGTCVKTYISISAYVASGAIITTPITIWPQLIDLTAMGIDNLTTTDEVEAWLAENIGTQSYYPYNAGQVLNVNMTGLESTGFNLLNPETHTAEIPGIYTEDYDNYYGIVGTYTSVTFTPAATGIAENITSDIDEEGKVLIEESGTITVTGDDSTTCVFLWWDGSQTESEPYEEPSVARIDVSHIKGVAVGSSSTESEIIFPYGMCGIGDVKDEIFIEEGVVKAVKRIGAVDLGSLTWGFDTTNKILYKNGFTEAKAVSNSSPSNLLTAKWNTIADNQGLRTTGIYLGISHQLGINDSTYSTQSAFEAAVNGVLLYYELATPITYASLQYEGSSYFSNGTAVELPINYTVNNWGLERILPANTTSAILTAKPTVTCEYATDVIETINTINDEIDNLKEEKANVKGAYRNMTVGNLISDASTPRQFYYSKTAGEGNEIGSGYANVNDIKGNTIVWNQIISLPSSGETKSDVTYTIDNGSLTFSGTASSDVYFVIKSPIKTIANHRVWLTGCPEGGSSETYMVWLQSYGAGTDYYEYGSGRLGTIMQGTATHYLYNIRFKEGTVTDGLVFTPQLFDLTQMFGSSIANSITVDQFKSMFPSTYYPYNEGTLISLNPTSVVSTGFNLWDEEWEKGVLDDNGQNYNDGSGWVRDKNYIPVHPNQRYYFKVGSNVNMFVYFYDIDKNFIYDVPDYDQYNRLSICNNSFVIPSNAFYVRFFMTSSYGVVYKNDICINLSDTTANGIYKPHVETGSTDLSWISGITYVPEGETTPVQLFPNGLCSAGTIYDEVTPTKAIKRTKRVNLGEYTWTYDGNYFHTKITDLKTVPSTTPVNCTCINYQPIGLSPLSTSTDKRIAVAGNGYVYLRDSSHTSAPTTQDNWMDGVIMDYEILEPIEVPINHMIGYAVQPGGTEQLLPENTPSATPTTSEIIMDVTYPLDAVGTIQNLPTNYISAESMTAFIGAINTANVGFTVAMSYNSDTGKYSFVVTPQTV